VTYRRRGRGRGRGRALAGRARPGDLGDGEDPSTNLSDATRNAINKTRTPSVEFFVFFVLSFAFRRCARAFVPTPFIYSFRTPGRRYRISGAPPSRAPGRPARWVTTPVRSRTRFWVGVRGARVTNGRQRPRTAGSRRRRRHRSSDRLVRLENATRIFPATVRSRSRHVVFGCSCLLGRGRTIFSRNVKWRKKHVRHNICRYVVVRGPSGYFRVGRSPRICEHDPGLTFPTIGSSC